MDLLQVVLSVVSTRHEIEADLSCPNGSALRLRSSFTYSDRKRQERDFLQVQFQGCCVLLFNFPISLHLFGSFFIDSHDYYQLFVLQ